jgi:hypothetical protein
MMPEYPRRETLAELRRNALAALAMLGVITLGAMLVELLR